VSQQQQGGGGSITRRNVLTSGLRFLAATGGVALLAACGGGAAAPTAVPATKPVAGSTPATASTAAAPVAASKAATTVRFLVQSGADSENRYNPVLDMYKKVKPDVAVQLDYSGVSAAEVQQKLLLAISGGTPPDGFWTHTYTNAGLASLGVPADLNPYISKDTTFKKETLFPAAVKDFEQNGKQFALPRETTSTILIYNKSLFDKASLQTPQPAWTWDNYLDAAQKLTQGDGASKVYGTGGWQQQGYAYYAFVRVWQEGGDVLNEARTQYTLNQDPGVRAIQWITDLVHKYKVHTGTTELQGTSLNDAFNSGRVGMMPSISVYSAYLGAKFEWDIQHLPHAGKQVTRNASAGHSLTAGSKVPDQTWDFLKFLVGKDVNDHFAKTGLPVTNIESAEAVAKSRGDTPPKNFQIGIDALAYARPEPVTGAWISIHSEIANALDGVYGPSAKDPKAQLDGIATRVNDLLKAQPTAGK
jgi:multiple sugar transport system substrate-binding protein